MIDINKIDFDAVEKVMNDYEYEQVTGLPAKIDSTVWISKYRPMFDDVNNIPSLLPDKEKERFNGILSNSQNPQEELQKVGMSMLMADKLGVNLSDVYDNYNARSYALFQKEMPIASQFDNMKELLSGNIEDLNKERKDLAFKAELGGAAVGGGRFPLMYDNVISKDEKARLNLLKFMDTGVPLLSTSEKAQEVLKSFKRGSASLLYGASLPARFLGADSLADATESYIDEVAKDNEINPQYRNVWENMKGKKYLDLDWWMVNGSEQLPFQLAAMAVSGGAGTAFNLGAKAIGLASKAVKIGTIGSASIAGAMSEGLVEGGRTAHEMIKMGASKEEAAIAGWSVMRRNTALLTASNGLNIMLGFAPGKITKVLAMATGTATEPIEELWQDDISKTAMVETLPRLIEQITPADSFLEIFDIRDPEKLDTFMLSLMMGFSEPSTGMFLRAVDNSKNGTGTAVNSLKAEKAFNNAAINEYKQLSKRPVLNEYEQKVKELGDKYIRDEAFIENTKAFAREKYQLQRQESMRQAEEINTRYDEGEIKLSEMSKKDLAEAAGVDAKTDFNKAELLNIIKKKATKLEPGKIKEFKQQVIENDIDVSKMKKKELAVALGLPENTPFSKKELADIAEKGGAALAPQVARDMLLDFLKKTDEGKVAYKTFEGKSLQDRVDAGEMTEVQAQKFAEDAGLGALPLDQIIEIGKNYYNENEVISQIVELAINPEFDPTTPDANISTVIEERVHRYFNSRFRWDGENNRFKDEWFNQTLQEARAAAEGRGFSSPKNDAELIAEWGVDYALSENPEQYIKDRGFSAKFKQVLDSIREYIQELLKNVGIVQNLYKEGAINEDLMSLIKDSITGEIQTANVQDYISKNPEVKQAAEELNNLQNKITPQKQQNITQEQQELFRSFEAGNVLKNYSIADKINELGKIRKKPKDYKGGEYDGFIPYQKTGGLGRFIYGDEKSGLLPDEMANILYEEGVLNSPDVNEMWQAIEGEIGGYKSRNENRLDKGKKLLPEEEQAVDFAEDTEQPSRRNQEEVKAEELSVGDKVTVKYFENKQLKQEELEVTDIDPDTFEVTLKDGMKYGVQKIEDGQTFYAANVESNSENAGFDFDGTFQLSENPQINTPEFKQWFGDSKVVDKDGKPLVVHHGTNQKFNIFDTAKMTTTAYGRGFYFTDKKDYAEGYANKRYSDAHVKDVYLSIKKPMSKDTPIFSDEELRGILKRAAELETEYDGEDADIMDSFLSNYEYGDIDIMLDEAVELERDNDNAIDAMNSIVGAGASFDFVAQAVKEVTGYDGVIEYIGDEEGTFFVVFTSTQIKSATDNRGTFDANNPDITFQFAGAKSQTADTAMLQKAKEMEHNGEDPKTILKETGWFEGMDGYWRYEISDLDKVKIKDDAFQKQGNETIYTLDALIDHPDLFDAYPELGNALVRTKKGLKEQGSFKPGTPGDDDYFPTDPEIAINADLSPTEKLKTLNHEIQHAIQHIEGFAKGGSPYQFTELSEEARKKNEQKINAYKSEIEAFNIYLNNPNELKLAAEFTGESPEDFKEYIIKKGRENWDKIQKLLKNEITHEDAFKQYQNLAGEIEARDTENRGELFAKERREIFPDVRDNANVTFQFAEDNKAWNKQLDDFIDGNLEKRRNAKVLSVTPDILQLLNADNLPIRIHPKILNKVVNEKHDITIKQLREIIDHLYNPTAVFESNPNAMRMPGEALVVFTDMMDSEGKPIMIGLYLDKKEGTFDINVIGSIYGKRDLKNIKDWHSLGLLRYVNTKRVSKWPSSARRHLPGDSTLKNSKDILTQESDIVKPLLDDYQSLKSFNNQTNQLSTLPEIAKRYTEYYDQIRKIENVFDKYGADWYLEQAHEIKQQILGRIEEITGREAPFNHGKAAEDSYMRGTKTHLRYMQKDEYATDKFIENLRNGSVEDMNYMREELQRLSKQIKAQSFESGRLAKAARLSKEEITTIQKELNSYIAAAPPEVRGNYRLLNRLTTIAGIENAKDQERYINKTLEVVDELIEENNKWNLIREMYEDLRRFREQKDSSGRLVSRKLTPAMQNQIKFIKEAMSFGDQKVNESIAGLMSILEGNKDNAAREWNDSELRRFLILDTFGNITGKTSKEVEAARNELNSIIEKGMMQRELLENQYREKLAETQGKTIDIVTGGKGIIRGKAAETIKQKHNNYWWKAAKFPENFVMGGYSFEYLMDALSRNDINTEHLNSFLNKHFSREVHKASQSEETGRRARQQEHIAALARIFGINPKQNNKLKKTDSIKFESKLKEFTKKVETPVKKWAFQWSDKPLTFDYDQAVQFKEKIQTGKGSETWKDIKNLEEVVQQIYTFIDEVDTAMQEGKPVKESIDVYILEDKGNYENIKMSQDEAVQYYLMGQQPDIEFNMRIHGWDNNSFKALEEFLTIESKNYADWLQATYDQQYEPMNQVYKKLFFVDMPKVKNYARAVFKVNKAGNEGVESASDIMAGGKIAGSAFATANPKTIVQRVAHRRELEQASAMQTYLRSVYESEHFINFGELSKELRGVFKNEKVRNAIDQQFGKTKLKYVNNQIDTIISGGVSQNDFDKMSNVIRGMTTQLVLSFKMMNLFKQITSLPAYSFDMPMAEFLKGVAKFWGNPSKNIKLFLETDFFKNRWEAGYSQELRNALHRSEGKPKNYFREALDLGMMPTKVGDIVPIIIGYNAVYQYKYNLYKKDGLSHEVAHREASVDAEMATERTQQAGSTKDLGYFQSINSSVLLFQMFLTSPRQYMNAVYSSIDAAIAGRPGAKKAAAKKTLVAWMVLSFAFQAASDLFKSMFDDDYELDWRNYGVAMTLGPLNGLPLAGNMINFTVRKLYGLYAGTPQFIAATNDLYAGIINSVGDLIKGEPDKVTGSLLRSTGAGQTIKAMTGGYSKKKNK